jgi:hypothetical protein
MGFFNIILGILRLYKVQWIVLKKTFGAYTILQIMVFSKN